MRPSRGFSCYYEIANEKFAENAIARNAHMRRSHGAGVTAIGTSFSCLFCSGRLSRSMPRGSALIRPAIMALLASYIPALRATQADPAIAPASTVTTAYSMTDRQERAYGKAKISDPAALALILF